MLGKKTPLVCIGEQPRTDVAQEGSASESMTEGRKEKIAWLGKQNDN